MLGIGVLLHTKENGMLCSLVEPMDAKRVSIDAEHLD